MVHGSVVDTIERFNRTFERRLDACTAVCGDARLLDAAPDRRMVNRRLDGNIVSVNLLRKELYSHEIQILQGVCIVTTAQVAHWGISNDSCYELTLSTTQLHTFDAYPLCVVGHEFDDFYEDRGYGRLSLYFAGLLCTSLRADLRILCKDAVAAYTLFVLFRPTDARSASPSAGDVECDSAPYLSQLHARGSGFECYEDFREWFEQFCADSGDDGIEYTIHATKPNADAFTRAIEQWTADHVTLVSDQVFTANFIHCPTRVQYATTPLLQLCYPPPAADAAAHSHP